MQNRYIVELACHYLPDEHTFWNHSLHNTSDLSVGGLLPIDVYKRQIIYNCQFSYKKDSVSNKKYAYVGIFKSFCILKANEFK